MKRARNIIAGVVLISAVAAVAYFAGRFNNPAFHAYDHRAASLVNEQGVTVDMRDYEGKFLLVYFGYSQCRRDCPHALGLVSHVMETLGADAGAVRALFISLDTRDTPAQLEGFMRQFHPGIEALTFRDRESLRNMCGAFDIFMTETSVSGSESAISGHEPALFLLDRSGGILDRFDFPVAPEEVLGAIKDHSQEEGIAI